MDFYNSNRKFSQHILSVILGFIYIFSHCNEILAQSLTQASVQKSKNQAVFFQPIGFGSERLFNPLSAFLDYTLDPIQVTESFTTDNFSEHLGEVEENLHHPKSAINREGSFKEFVHKEIFPIYPNRLHKSKSILPNVGLHFFEAVICIEKMPNGLWPIR